MGCSKIYARNALRESSYRVSERQTNNSAGQ